MKLLSILTLLGFNSCSAEEIKKTQHGNFTIHQSIDIEKSEGQVFNREYDTRSYLIRYEVFFHGKKIKLPSPLQKNTGYNYAWRIFIVPDANVPSLIVASQNAFLLIEVDGKVVIRKLNQHHKKFSTFQWLDNEEGQPGAELQLHGPQNDDRLDSSLIFQGGKFLLVNRESILNLETLTVSHFNKSNAFEHQGWRIFFDGPAAFETAVGFSRRFNQVAFRALKLDENVEGRYSSAILTFDIDTDSMEVLPFLRTPLRIESLENLSALLFQKYFAWSEVGKLCLNPKYTPPPWRGRLDFGDSNLINYRLYPVKETIVPAFIGHLEKQFGDRSFSWRMLDSNEVQKKIQVNIAELKFILTYLTNELKLIFEIDFSQDFAKPARDIVAETSESFDYELLENKHQHHFGRFNENE